MDTKWKSWTARRSVKISCAILVPILIFISIIGVIGLGKLRYASDNLLFADLDKNDYFYDNYVPNATSWAQDLFFLRNEEHIRNMGCLEWQYSGNNHEISAQTGQYYTLATPNRAKSWYYGTINAEDIDSAQAQRMIDDAINQLLNEYYYAKTKLEETPGVYYFVTDDARWIGNVSPDTDAAFFRAQPAYYITEPGKAFESSRDGAGPYTYLSYSSAGMDEGSSSLYVAFSSEMVDRQNSVWKEARRQLETQLLMIIVPQIFALVLIIILLVGAGRVYNDESRFIHFTALDKPWLDLSLCLLAAYAILAVNIFYELVSIIWRYKNFNWIIALSAVLSVLLVPPMLWWLVSFVKYCKAGKWWRHTFFYAFIHGVFSSLTRFAKSMWAGFPLTLKAVALGCALFAFAAVCVIVHPSAYMLLFAFAFVSLFVFGIMRYTRKLYLVARGAEAAGSGYYETPIAVSGGELGSIAASINNISEGISKAVSERLKSERFKTELITNISHDIRTPLTSMITYADLLKSEGLDCARAPEYLDILIQKSARLKTLTDDLFEASKAASGNIDARIDDLDLADLLRQALGEMDERLRESGLDFRVNLPEHAAVRADGKLMWRVIDNLLSNVFKYSLPGSRVYIDLSAEDGSYRLDIKNISEHPLNIDPSELTERFKRGDAARSGEGSGLGLSIAQSFVAAQGGRFALSIDGDLFKASVSLPASRKERQS